MRWHLSTDPKESCWGCGRAAGGQDGLCEDPEATQSSAWWRNWKEASVAAVDCAWRGLMENEVWDMTSGSESSSLSTRWGFEFHPQSNRKLLKGFPQRSEVIWCVCVAFVIYSFIWPCRVLVAWCGWDLSFWLADSLVVDTSSRAHRLSSCSTWA